MRSAWGPVAGGDEYYFGERRSNLMCAKHDARTAAASAAVQAQVQAQAPVSAAAHAQLSAVGNAAVPNGQARCHAPADAAKNVLSTQNRNATTAAVNSVRNVIPSGAPDKRQLQYLQQLSERNSALRRLRAVKSQQDVLKEKREQAFNMHWSGANDDRTRACAPNEHGIPRRQRRRRQAPAEPSTALRQRPSADMSGVSVGNMAIGRGGMSREPAPRTRHPQIARKAWRVPQQPSSSTAAASARDTTNSPTTPVKNGVADARPCTSDPGHAGSLDANACDIVHNCKQGHVTDGGEDSEDNAYVEDSFESLDGESLASTCTYTTPTTVACDDTAAAHAVTMMRSRMRASDEAGGNFERCDGDGESDIFAEIAVLVASLRGQQQLLLLDILRQLRDSGNRASGMYKREQTLWGKLRQGLHSCDREVGADADVTIDTDDGADDAKCCNSVDRTHTQAASCAGGARRSVVAHSDVCRTLQLDDAYDADADADAPDRTDVIASTDANPDSNDMHMRTSPASVSTAAFVSDTELSPNVSPLPLPQSPLKIRPAVSELCDCDDTSGGTLETASAQSTPIWLRPHPLKPLSAEKNAEEQQNMATELLPSNSDSPIWLRDGTARSKPHVARLSPERSLTRGKSKCCSGQSASDLTTPSSQPVHRHLSPDLSPQPHSNDDADVDVAKCLELEQGQEEEQQLADDEIEQHFTCYDDGQVVDFIYHSGPELRSS